MDGPSADSAASYASWRGERSSSGDAGPGIGGCTVSGDGDVRIGRSEPGAMMRRAWCDVLTALQFLTRVPVGSFPYDPEALSRAVLWFPLVGGFVGAAAAGVHWAVARAVSAPIAALATLIFLVLITGAFHEDGLADTADGLGGGWNRQQSLEIMRDSRIGTYGAIALILSLFARWLLLGS